MADNEGGLATSLVITELPELHFGEKTENEVIYDIASKLYTNTNFDLLEYDIASFAKLCIYRAKIFNEVYQEFNTTGSLDD